MKKVCIALYLCLLMAAPALCESSVWVVKDGDHTLYLGGTVHMLRETDYPFPAEYDKAYQKSDVLVLEADINAVQKPEFQQLIMSKAMYTDGSTLQSVLSEEAYAKLSDFCTKNGLPLASMQSAKVWMIGLSMAMMMMQQIGATAPGVDKYYYGQAATENKAVKFLETPEEQINVIASMGEGNESEFIIYEIDDFAKMKEDFDSLIKAWKAGDVKLMDELFLKELAEKFPKLYASLMTDRNRNWIPKIEEQLKTPETEFVLVGSGHLVGEEGVINLLKAKGYSVEKMN